MSMIGCFRRLGGSDLEKLLAEPRLIFDYLDAVEEAEGFGPFADLDVDKAWHGIHYLLTGTAWDGSPPLNFIVAGGHQVGDEDVGYGPARGFYPDEVKVLAAALDATEAKSLASRFDPDAMARAELYPDIWLQEGDEALEYLVDNLEALRDFVSGASKAGEGLLVYLT